MSSVTVAIADPPKTRFREMERFVGKRLYRKGTDSDWYADFQDRAEADLIAVNLNNNGFHAHLLHDF